MGVKLTAFQTAGSMSIKTSASTNTATEAYNFFVTKKYFTTATLLYSKTIIDNISHQCIVSYKSGKNNK